MHAELLYFVLLGLFFPVPSQEVTWEEYLQNDLFVSSGM